ncbi:MAG TPA: hypothetical protein VFS43_04735 [Polyangiaceae bacterium]|nr:hypothetical protein [Polyangiaceae bacterium]
MVGQNGGEGVGQGQAAWGDVSFGAALREYESLRAEIEALPASQIMTVRVDVQKVAAIVITLIERDSAPERRKKFERFAAQGDYDITLLDRLPALARSVWVLRRQQQRVLYVASGATVSEADRLAAFELRSRMMTELAYHCDDMPDILLELEYLRQGAGHQDMANDLETLADLYERPDVRARLEGSRKYRPGDPTEARRLAGLLLRSLGMSQESEVERLTGLLQRATTLMVQAYEKHSVRGKFLFHEVEDVEATYPSLYAAARSPRRKRPSDEPSGGGSGGEGPGDDGAGGEPGDDGAGPA